MEHIAELLKRAPEEAIALVDAQTAKSPDDLDALQLAAEVHFELGNAEQAHAYLTRAVEIDPKGTRGGFQKFLWAGQLEGGEHGLALYERGLSGLSAPREIVQGLLGMIEIWMTDMCMLPQAEQQCEALIARALLLDEASAETWSIMGSIRISQQRDADAQAALNKAWELFSESATQGELTATAIPLLVRLAQSMMEVDLWDTVLDVTTEVARLDDEVPDAYYLNALAHKELLPSATDEFDRSRHIVAARDALELLLALDSVDPEMAGAASELVAALPEPTVDVPDSDDEVADEGEDGD